MPPSRRVHALRRLLIACALMLERAVLEPTLRPRASGASAPEGLAAGLDELLALPVMEEPASRATAAACRRSVSMRMPRNCTLEGVHSALATRLAPSLPLIGGSCLRPQGARGPLPAAPRPGSAPVWVLYLGPGFHCLCGMQIGK